MAQIGYDWLTNRPGFKDFWNFQPDNLGKSNWTK